MEKRVIKFNLVGAICCLILIIAGIVGLIVGIPKLVNKTKEERNQPYQQAENKEEIDEDKQYIEQVEIGGRKIEVPMKLCKGTENYTIKYDFNNFSVDKNNRGVDRFISLLSSTINMDIRKEKGNVLKAPATINENDEGIEKEQIISYNILPTKINGIDGLRRVIKTATGIGQAYYLQVDDENYYVIDVTYGNRFEEEMAPILEYMVSTFQVI